MPENDVHVVSLPACSTASDGLPAAVIPALSPVMDERSKTRMLYVEDNRLNAALFEVAMQHVGNVELRLADCAEEALELVAHWTPQILVLDNQLPGMTGIELLVRMRKRCELAHVPAFMCSADAAQTHIAAALAAGFVGYWTKPVNLRSIFADIAPHCRRAAMAA